jgi:hypothetical protein
LRVAALQLTLELQLLAARLLQRSEQQQQQQEVTREAAGLLENSNLLLLAQLECHVALLDWSPEKFAASGLAASVMESRNLDPQGCVQLVQQLGLQLLQCLAAPVMVATAGSCSCDDPGGQLLALHSLCSVPCIATGGLPSRICCFLKQPVEWIAAKLAPC